MVKKYFKALLFDWRKKRAIRKAQNDAILHRKKFLVLVFNGKPDVVSMKSIKKLIRQRYFTKDFTAEKAEQLAIYIAYPPKK